MTQPTRSAAELAACRLELERLQGEFDGFSYAVAHDLRAPLRAVAGFLEALSEEYIFNKDGKLDNPSFLDYRMPVSSDLPMLDSVILEIPNPKHPQGVRGVGEVPLVPPLAAISNAVYDALGRRFYSLPMSPPKVLATMDMAAE